MAKANRSPNLHNTLQQQNVEEVIVLADLVGKSPTTLLKVVEDFIQIVPNPIVAGGFAMAYHGFVRATVDVDIIAAASLRMHIPSFVGRGYKHESVHLPIGHLELLTKGNKGVDFIHLDDQAFTESIETRAVIGLLHGYEVRYVSLEDLIILKSLALKGRNKKQDEADLEHLLKLSHDTAYVEEWKKRFGI